MDCRSLWRFLRFKIALSWCPSGFGPPSPNPSADVDPPLRGFGLPNKTERKHHPWRSSKNRWYFCSSARVCFNSKHAYWCYLVHMIPSQLRIFVHVNESAKLWNKNELWNLITFDFCFSLEKGVKEEMIDMLTVGEKRVKALLFSLQWNPDCSGPRFLATRDYSNQKSFPLPQSTQFLIGLTFTNFDFHFLWRLENRNPLFVFHNEILSFHSLLFSESMNQSNFI